MSACWVYDYDQARKPRGTHPNGEGWYACATGFEFERAERERARWRLESEERRPRQQFPMPDRVRPTGIARRPVPVATLMTMAMVLSAGGFNVVDE